MVVITEETRDVLLSAVRRMYTELALRPEGSFHFPTGRTACEFEGYDPELLDRVPPQALASFAGVNCPFRAAMIQPGQVVLDVGSGSGTDALLASLLVGPEGEVIGLDMTPAMRERLEANARTMGAANVRTLAGTAEEIPLPDGSVDVVTTNGVLNLVPDKARAVAEIARVLRPGGGVQVSDIVLAETPSEACRSQPELWAECIVGATREEAYLELFREAGFTEPEVLSRLDYFARAPSAKTREVASSFGANAIVFRARKESGE